MILGIFLDFNWESVIKVLLEKNIWIDLEIEVELIEVI